MGLGAGIDHQRFVLPLQAALGQGVIATALAGADQRHQGTGRGGVLDHPAPLIRQADHLPQPVDGGFFQFAQRRAGLPRQAEYAKAGAEEIAEHRRQGAVGGEVTEKIRMLPVGQAGHDQLVDVLEDLLERLTLSRRRGWQCRLEVTGLNLGHDRQFADTLAVVGDQVDQLVAMFAKFFRAHAAAPVVVGKWA
ncbi:hypothetical protein D3C80_1581440 [compost metagenome]